MIEPGATIGIIGGGQLGRMLAMAAKNLGYHTCVFTPEEAGPASQVADSDVIAAYDDEAALTRFAQQVDVVTFEFENVPHESLELLTSKVVVHPKPEVLKVCRNRLREKEMINAQGIGTAPFTAVRNVDGLRAALEQIGVPSVLKTTELGYDGRGQVKIDLPDEAEAAWTSLNTNEAVLEGWVSFEREISIIIARNAQGEMATFEPAHNIHKEHILDKSIVPAGVSDETVAEAKAIAEKLAQALDIIGLLAVELFVTDDGLLVNELAPRPHNSGHWTIEAAGTSQFEQHIRAICGKSLGNSRTLAPVEMVNLIGEGGLNLEPYEHDPNQFIHLYGKKDARPGRKMGHVTILKSEE